MNECTRITQLLHSMFMLAFQFHIMLLRDNDCISTAVISKQVFLFKTDAANVIKISSLPVEYKLNQNGLVGCKKN